MIFKIISQFQELHHYFYFFHTKHKLFLAPPSPSLFPSLIFTVQLSYTSPLLLNNMMNSECFLVGLHHLTIERNCIEIYISMAWRNACHTGKILFLQNKAVTSLFNNPVVDIVQATRVPSSGAQTTMLWKRPTCQRMVGRLYELRASSYSHEELNSQNSK